MKYLRSSFMKVPDAQVLATSLFLVEFRSRTAHSRAYHSISNYINMHVSQFENGRQVVSRLHSVRSSNHVLINDSFKKVFLSFIVYFSSYCFVSGNDALRRAVIVEVFVEFLDITARTGKTGFF